MLIGRKKGVQNKMIINALLMLWTALSIITGIMVYGGVAGPLDTFMVMTAYLATAVIWWFKGEYEK
jgi:hypothetical protein